LNSESRIFHDFDSSACAAKKLDSYIAPADTANPSHWGGENERKNMAKVASFHSVKEPHYHDNDKCGPGSEIPAHNKVSGTGGKPHCKDCAKLNAEGK
jgi:hypothetical protein